MELKLAKVRAKAIGTGDDQYEIRVWANSPDCGRICAQRYTVWENRHSGIRLVEATFRPQGGKGKVVETSHFPDVKEAVLRELRANWQAIRTGALTAPVEANGYRGIYEFLTGEPVPRVQTLGDPVEED